MLNQEMRTVTMSRSDMLRVQQALTHVVMEFQREATDPDATDDCREIAERSLSSSAASNHTALPGGHEGRKENTMTNQEA